MSKNIFIGGVSRAGKSTLSQMLKKEKYNHIPLDYFVVSLKINFPETGISDSAIINESSEKVALFLSSIIERINRRDEKFIIDSAHIMPHDIIKYLDKDKWDIYYLGYPDTTKEKKLENIRKHDSKVDWTNKLSDEQLLNVIDKLINISKKIETECKNYNIKFINTSENMDILNKINNEY